MNVCEKKHTLTLKYATDPIRRINKPEFHFRTYIINHSIIGSGRAASTEQAFL